MAVHEPIVAKELFDAVEDRARRNRGPDQGCARRVSAAPRPSRRAAVRAARTRALRAVRAAHGGHPPAPLKLVSLPLRGQPRPRRRRSRWPPDSAADQRRAHRRSAHRVHGPPPVRTRPPAAAARRPRPISVADSWREHDTDLARLRVERDEIDRALSARACASKSTTTHITPSSRSQPGASRSSAHDAPQSTEPSARSTHDARTARGRMRSRHARRHP